MEFDSIQIACLDKVIKQSILNLTAGTILTHQDSLLSEGYVYKTMFKMAAYTVRKIIYVDIN